MVADHSPIAPSSQPGAPGAAPTDALPTAQERARLRWVRYVCAAVLVAAAVTIGVLLLPLLNPSPQVLAATAGDASIQFQTNRTVAGTDGCIEASWDVEGAQTVLFGWYYTPPQEVAGRATQQVCPQHDSFVQIVADLPDGTREIYQLTTIISIARGAPGYLLVMALLIGSAGVLALRPQWLAALRVPPAAPTGRGLPRWEWAVLAVLLLVTFLAYVPARYNIYGGDFEGHGYYSHRLANGEAISSPHFVLQLFTIATVWLTGGDMTQQEPFFAAMFWVNQGAMLVMMALIYFFMRYWLGAPGHWRTAAVYALLAVAGMWMAPIFFPTLLQRDLFLGYIPTSNMFHNPTYALMRPMSLAVMWIGIRLVRGEVERPVWVGLGAAGLAVLSLITKPNHTIIYVPALGLAILWTLLRQRRIQWTMVGIILATVPVLAIQFNVFFTAAEVESFTPTSRVIVRPLAVMLARESSLSLIAVKFVLSNLFPVALYAAYFRQSRQNGALNFVWAAYLIALFYAFILAEENRYSDGNFVFSAQIGLDMVMITSIAWFAQLTRQTLPARDWRFVAVGTLLTLHVAAGLIWQIVNLTSGYGFFWWGYDRF